MACMLVPAGASVDDVAITTAWSNQGQNISHTDWMAGASALAMPVLPTEGNFVAENPPLIAWPTIANAPGYQLELKSLSAAIGSYSVSDNFFALPTILRQGKYFWRVKPVSRSGISNWSDWREFSVNSDARPFSLPAIDVLVSQVAASPHPRGFPRGEEKRLFLLNYGTTLAAGWNRLKIRVAGYYEKPLLNESMAPSSVGLLTKRMLAQQTLALPEFVNREAQQIVEASWLWQMEKDNSARNDVKNRILNFASWDANGGTSYGANARAARSVLRAMSVGYDACHETLTVAEKAVLIAAIEARLAQIMAAADSGPFRLGAMPFDTTQWVTLQAATAATSLIAGDSTRGSRWLERLLPWAVYSISPWGGDDGGYGNGTAYAGWTMDSLFYSWDSLRFATGIDVYKKRWLRAFGNYLTYFVPPGSPSGAFGEAAENMPETKYGKGLAYRLPLSLNRWFGAQLTGNDASDLVTLSAGAGSRLAPDSEIFLPPSAVFPSIGWAAMHSSLPDKNRTSIYFKSSSYGSFNHSHADQNSFVINAKGKRLAIDSGYYDWYGSPHWANWYKQTIAHNAISFDGGQGQLINRKDASGEITYFNSAATYDSVGGNAVKAYGGALARAQRDLVYLRPGLLLVYDALESAIPRVWEWNIHSVNRMNQLSNTSIELVNGDARVCIDILAAPKMAFAQSDQFSADPDKPAGSWAKQWHGRFASSSVSTRAEIIALLRMDCVGASGVSVRRVAADMVVTAGSHVISFAPGKAASVQ